LCFIASLYNPHTEVPIQLSKGQLTSGKMLRILGRFAAGGLGGGTGWSAQDKKTSGDQRKIAFFKAELSGLGQRNRAGRA
jgi:hypothetical protein